uniref:Uncharacterized protein n=1 Tax=Populus trichocarpa TaxID=3694 RepID=A0A3N7I6V4_POPTR
MKYKATEKNKGTYLMRGDEVEDEGAHAERLTIWHKGR